MNLSGMPQAETPNQVVKNDGFCPDLNVAEFVESYAIPAQYGNNSSMMVQKLRLAIISVNKDLTFYRAENWLGYSTLAEVPSDDFEGESLLVTLYKHAVFSLAKSFLLVSSLGETHRDKAAVKALESSDSEQHWVKQSNEAIRQMINTSKNLSVELI